jgi:hypothetical protein
MITIEDCIALCGLTREEIDAVAEHEHLPEAAASDGKGGDRRSRCPGDAAR